MNEVRKVNPKIVALVAALVVLVVFCVVYFVFREKPVEGIKNITIEVVYSNGESDTYKVKTDAKYLRGAMEDAEGLEFSGSESAYGLVLKTVNGEYADFETAYWSPYVNGEMCNYGVDSQVVEDGDAFKIIYSSVEEFSYSE